MAFSSATHDIAADGFYMLGLKEHQQSAFIGVRTIFYRIAVIAAKGILVVFAGNLETKGFSIQSAWSFTFFLLAAMMLALCIYHLFLLPFPEADRPVASEPASGSLELFLRGFATFFRRRDIIPIILFFLFYRFAEAQLVKMVAPFLLDGRAEGGLGLSTSEVGVVYGTVGAIALMAGGLLGGLAASRNGLKYWIWIMVLAMHLPDVIFIYLSAAQPQSLWIINAAIAIEQFGYGFGFTAYSLYMIMVCEGEYKTVHYAISTGIMALGMMIPAMSSGWIQEHLGYAGFFVWILVSTVPGFIVTAMVRIDPAFGRKKE
jgi:PAT family beta-lactamase induction signal transducer AmpG